MNRCLSWSTLFDFSSMYSLLRWNSETQQLASRRFNANSKKEIHLLLSTARTLSTAKRVFTRLLKIEGSSSLRALTTLAFFIQEKSTWVLPSISLAPLPLLAQSLLLSIFFFLFTQRWIKSDWMTLSIDTFCGEWNRASPQSDDKSACPIDGRW